MTHPSKAIMADGVTPMEARFAVEITKAVTGIKAQKASEIVNRLLEKYENDISYAPIGKKYPECYDVVTRKPNEAYIRLYDEVKEELAGMGLPF